MTVICPACGNSINADAAPIESLKYAQLSEMERRITDALSDKYPLGLSKNEIIDVLYGSDPEGGALTASETVPVLVSRIRDKLAPFGWSIPKHHGGRGNIAFYKLQPAGGDN